MRNNILMKINTVDMIREGMNNSCCEIIVSFSCQSPIGDMETSALIARYFDDGESFETTFEEDNGLFYLTGKVTMTRAETICNLAPGEYMIPLSTVLANELRAGRYNAGALNACTMAEVWFGERGDVPCVQWK